MMTGDKCPKLDEIGRNLDEIDGNFVKLVEVGRNFGENWSTISNF